jgi:hypothetical protein
LQEERLLQCHSEAAKSYYNAIRLKESNLDEYKNHLMQALQNDHYKVLASYGEEGRIRLMNVIFTEVASLYELTKLMSDDLPIQYWKALMEDITKSEKFNHIDLNEEMNLAESDEVQFDNENHLRAYLLCLSVLYKINRQAGPEYTSNLSYLGSFIFASYSKEEKIKACSVYQDFLLSGTRLNEIEQYLQEKKLYDTHWGALSMHYHMSNTLSRLVKLGVDKNQVLEEVQYTLMSPLTNLSTIQQ